ncbi:hypothetical protein [Kitasatospora sp. NPDC058190]|uniref:hypothetical protein n=1 Tax=Kitasatospora sp. NPDC058190 TaxID=3346371 RepID=UPI0036DA7D6D
MDRRAVGRAGDDGAGLAAVLVASGGPGCGGVHVWLVALADDPVAVLPSPAGTAVADAVCAAAGFAFAARARLGMLKVPTWLLVSAACRGCLLAPGWPWGPARPRM